MCLWLGLNLITVTLTLAAPLQLYIKENSDKKLVPHQSDVVKMQFVDHLNQSNAKRKKGVFSWLRKSR